ncbi:hypothetical protein RIR_jg2346.t1 [Rhizophagus irregularis DAOM 181602=DAOM 197198]|nr:hypothetical protein RIR_jg2346.t1 [Rhizophagus irregularis DAOM 181602=DAOM 197198]
MQTRKVFFGEVGVFCKIFEEKDDEAVILLTSGYANRIHISQRSRVKRGGLSVEATKWSSLLEVFVFLLPLQNTQSIWNKSILVMIYRI